MRSIEVQLGLLLDDQRPDVVARRLVVLVVSAITIRELSAEQ